MTDFSTIHQNTLKENLQLSTRLERTIVLYYQEFLKKDITVITKEMLFSINQSDFMRCRYVGIKSLKELKATLEKLSPLAAYSDEQLVEELRLRGLKVVVTKTISL